MTGIIHYRGHSARIEFDPDDMIFTGRLAGINDVVGFHATDTETLIRAFHDAVDDYVETCARLGKVAEKPFSGRVMFRVQPEVHAKAARAAQLAGKSLNQWAAEALQAAAERSPGLTPASAP
ncbi:type II toxin-antitoxin system HicB family antitoxin [Sandaracinobacteroides saxicola]|uniref:Type II toxin-antitoxin system HicB family antitoxin n=1 Tax=Sandaracinobacteroides saxicola TaxID=2759707 RepID=A0A7G5IK36_9SPHN|nr:type II toxin-antitoxin system HicB family antitoxin [Sandaracinobacteroides saxicola]QMW23728.1 type II toxin-antitoxin system HicB family antitoxin [Sandaracinobacteroides saxicola]